MQLKKRQIIKEAILEIVTETVHLFNEEINIDFGDGLIGNDTTEEVGQLALWLVANHQSTGRHHSTFQDRRDL